MTTTGQTSGYQPLPAPSAMPSDPPLTLVGEHALLLSQVMTRAEDLLAVTAKDRWPARELQALLGYLSAEVMGQDQERLLFPAEASAGISRLARDHARLRAAIETLERVAAGVHLVSRPARRSHPGSPLPARAPPARRGGSAGGGRPTPGKVPATTTLGGHPMSGIRSPRDR